MKKGVFIEEKPFEFNQSQKEKLFLPYIYKMARWHYAKNSEFKNLCINRNFDVFSDFNLSELPYLPVSLFKKFDLLSVPKRQIVKTLYSSSTSGNPSKIMLDQITANNQIKALNNIMQDFFGRERFVFIVFDNGEVIKSNNGELSSRGTAIRGMLSLSRRLEFVLTENLELDIQKLKRVLISVNKGGRVCFFGFTWLMYSIYKNYLEDKEVRERFKMLKCADKILLHIGGWKKLQDLSISREVFNKNVANFLNISSSKIVDFYGMTEQLGTVYPDCPFGYKHVPLYSEIIIRDLESLEPAKIGKTGLIQLVSPLPNSYPGISLLTDDIGKIIGVDRCQCGRKGKYFVFEKRMAGSEIKGCGDTLSI